MLDAKAEVLYVGKARSLKKRVASYAKPVGHDARIGRMIAATCSRPMSWTSCGLMSVVVIARSAAA